MRCVREHDLRGASAFAVLGQGQALLELRPKWPTDQVPHLQGSADDIPEGVGRFQLRRGWARGLRRRRGRMRCGSEEHRLRLHQGQGRWPQGARHPRSRSDLHAHMRCVREHDLRGASAFAVLGQGQALLELRPKWPTDQVPHLQGSATVDARAFARVIGGDSSGFCDGGQFSIVKQPFTATSLSFHASGRSVQLSANDVTAAMRPRSFTRFRWRDLLRLYRLVAATSRIIAFS